jgi:TPR repeat protein
VAAAGQGDFATAVSHWRLAASRGHAKAQYNLGVSFARGRGVSLDLAEAHKWWSEAASQGHSEAARQLAGVGTLPKPSPNTPTPTKSRSSLGNLWSLYLVLGAPFALAKFGSLMAWMVFGGIGRPDLPWYWRLTGESLTMMTAFAGAALTMLGWPYHVYVLLTEGSGAFLRSMFYLWY